LLFIEITSMLCFGLIGIVSTVNSKFNARDGELSRASRQVIFRRPNFILSRILAFCLRKFIFGSGICINNKSLHRRAVQFCKNTKLIAIGFFKYRKVTPIYPK
jgi:hypothetical protein